MSSFSTAKATTDPDPADADDQESSTIPFFGTRIHFVKNDLSYAVRYGDTPNTRWFKASVFDYPALRQADAQLKAARIHRPAEKKIEDTRSINAIEGTTAMLTFASQ